MGKGEKMRIKTESLSVVCPSSTIYCSTNFLRHTIVGGQLGLVVFHGVFDLCVKKLCWSRLHAEILECSNIRSVPIVSFMGFCSFESGLICFFSRQALFCEYIIPRCIVDAFVHKMCFFIKEVSYAES